MPSTRDIRRRIKSVKNTAQITRAMQLVAASKMKKAQDSALAGRPYAALLGEILGALSHRQEELVHPFLEARDVRTRGVLLISTDKGLCGGLNANLFRLVGDFPRESTRFVTIGRKGTQYLTRTGRKLEADFTVSDKAQFREVRPAIEFLVQAYLDHKIDSIEVLYTDFVNTLKQDPMRVPILPITDLDHVLEKLAQAAGISAMPEDTREVKFEPDVKQILDDLLQLYIRREVYHLFLEAKASEHSARMVAMKTATDNAGNLVDDLTLEYNKVRQAAITQEILEIAAATANN